MDLPLRFAFFWLAAMEPVLVLLVVEVCVHGHRAGHWTRVHKKLGVSALLPAPRRKQMVREPTFFRVVKLVDWFDFIQWWGLRFEELHQLRHVRLHGARVHSKPSPCLFDDDLDTPDLELADLDHASERPDNPPYVQVDSHMLHPQDVLAPVAGGIVYMHATDLYSPGAEVKVQIPNVNLRADEPLVQTLDGLKEELDKKPLESKSKPNNASWQR
eukprot:CAMPEP_0117522216 /NCGR_PEP_ID=MMETSP0784-20121206/34092_1 /TAXON_ID=39447 /ORGANISM="" /LENGTH=214 /DNA_ID=CAMNT_0005318279 /DNA_START=835 /DNA_END=1479 /DNA_ORIENTATION=-